MEDKILDFSNWTKFCNEWCGLYRYAVSPKCAYEIVVEGHYLDTPIETAMASLYIVGLWDTSDGGTLLEREMIGESLPIQELLPMAYRDYRASNRNKR